MKIKKISHRSKFLCSNCLYSGKCVRTIPPQDCPSCKAQNSCQTVWYRIRFPSKTASKQRWKEALTAMGWIERAKMEGEGYEYDDFIRKVVRRALTNNN